jgi:hypothetical protein
MRIGIGIVAVVIAIAMLVSIPSATAGEPIEVMGIVAYENGTWVPDGWPGWTKNVNRTYNAMSFTTEVNPFIGNIYVTDQYDSFDEYLRVNCTSPDGRWFGENTRRINDAYDWDMQCVVINITVMQCVVINITVYEVPVETENFTKSLPLGWNLISLPLAPLDNSTSAVLGNATIAYNAVKQYDATTKTFVDATTMDPGTGYFVHVTTAGTWGYEGTAYDSINVSLSQGLNMVGWTNETGSALPGALSSTGGNYRYVARWNASSQSYEVYLPGAPAVFNDFTTMDRGVGYFIAATSSCMLTYP